MDDEDLEERLRAYRPADPPAELRARVVGQDRSAESLALRPVQSPALQPVHGARASRASGLAWLPAVAALLLATIFYWLAASDRARLFAQFPVTDSEETIDLHLENQP